MNYALALSRTIDQATSAIGRSVAWLIVAAAVISASNAIMRKVFDASSNAWLELQWWLFGLVFLLAAPWTLASNEHVRIDIVSSRLSPFTRNVIELIGIGLFLAPVCLVLIVTSWPFVMQSLPDAAALSRHLSAFELSPGWLTGFSTLGEQSSNAGGLPQWPIKLLIPVAFALLLMQALSQAIKRIAVMAGAAGEPAHDRTYHETVIDMPERRDGA